MSTSKNYFLVSLAFKTTEDKPGIMSVKVFTANQIPLPTEVFVEASKVVPGLNKVGILGFSKFPDEATYINYKTEL